MSSSTLDFLRIPAVSIRVYISPSYFSAESIVSLVVPAISLTIERSLFNNLFKSEDFPAFGLPRIAMLSPSEISLVFLSSNFSTTASSKSPKFVLCSPEIPITSSNPNP